MKISMSVFDKFADGEKQ